MNNEILKPGTECPVSGQYLEVGPRGGSQGNEITSVEGKKLPPTSKSGNGFLLVDPTNHKGRK